MAVSKKKIGRFITAKESVKEVAKDNDLNVDLSDSPFLNSIGFKFLLALSKRNINTVRDLVFSDVADILIAVNGSEAAVTKMNRGLRRLYLSYSNSPKIDKYGRVFIPDVNLTKAFAIIKEMSKEELAVLIGLDNVDNARLLNALEKAEIQTFQDLKDAGIEKVQKLPGLGRKSCAELLKVVESFHLNQDEEIDDVISQFRNHLLDAKREVKDDYDVKPLETKLYGYIAEFVNSLNLGRNGEVFNLRVSPEKMTLESIARRYGFTRERVRQIVTKVSIKVVSCFTNRNKASTVDCIRNFYLELISIDKEIVLYPIHVLIEKKDTITEILYNHFKAIGLLPSDIVVIKPEPVVEEKPVKKRKTKVVPDIYMTNGILSAVQANNGLYRVGKLVDLLHGTFDYVFDKDYSKGKEYFGWGKSYTIDYIVDSIYYLINDGSLHQMRDGTSKLYVTNKGRAVLEAFSRHIIEDK